MFYLKYRGGWRRRLLLMRVDLWYWLECRFNRLWQVLPKDKRDNTILTPLDVFVYRHRHMAEDEHFTRYNASIYDIEVRA